MDHDHIDAEDVTSRYVMGRLGDEEERAFEAHLVSCQACIEAVASEVSLRDGLRAIAAESGSRLPVSAAAPRATAMRRYGWLQAAAAVLLAVAVGLGAWLWRSVAELDAARAERDRLQGRARQAEQSASALQRRLADGSSGDARAQPSAPRVVPAAVFALTTVRGSSSADAPPVNRIHLAPGVTLVVFSVDVPPTAGSAAYDVSLKDRAARVLWSGGTFPTSSSDSLGVAIDRALLPDGDYVLELWRRSPGAVGLISRYAFRVEAP